jgi:outer membrane immunogenic protein
MRRLSGKIASIGLCENDWLRLTGDDHRQVQSMRWSVVMRLILLAAMMCGVAAGAQAADLSDLPILRGAVTDSGSHSRRNWDGWYAGGQVGYTSADMDFSHSVKTLTNFMLRNSVLEDPVSQWSLLSKNHAQATGFGGFVGRNWQWDEVVVGVEANYNYMNSLASSSTNSMSLNIVNPAGENTPAGHTHTYSTTLSGTASLQIKDVVTFRGRAGWVAGDFLPYMFGGLAVGRVDTARAATVSYTKFDDYDQTTQSVVGGVLVSTTTHIKQQIGAGSVSAAEHRTNSFVAGWTAGLGTEYNLWGNLFMRAEWEYVRFMSVKDTSFSTNNVRAGLGYKF